MKEGNAEEMKIQGVIFSFINALLFLKETSCFVRPRKRFVWPDTLHRDFVGAVLDVGLRGATPALVLESFHLSANLSDGSRRLTSEQVRAQLQKYEVFRAYYKQKKVERGARYK